MWVFFAFYKKSEADDIGREETLDPEVNEESEICENALAIVIGVLKGNTKGLSSFFNHLFFFFFLTTIFI